MIVIMLAFFMGEPNPQVVRLFFGLGFCYLLYQCFYSGHLTG